MASGYFMVILRVRNQKSPQAVLGALDRFTFRFVRLVSPLDDKDQNQNQ